MEYSSRFLLGKTMFETVMSFEVSFLWGMSHLEIWLSDLSSKIISYSSIWGKVTLCFCLFSKCDICDLPTCVLYLSFVVWSFLL